MAMYNNEEAKMRTLLSFIDLNNYDQFISALNNSIILTEYLNDLLILCLSSYSLGNIYIAQYIIALITKGANPNINIYNKLLTKPEPNSILTPLQLAIKMTDYQLVQFLLKQKDAINQLDNHSNTLLDNLINSKSTESKQCTILQLLLDNHFPLNLREIIAIIKSNKTFIINYLLETNHLQLNSIISEEDGNTLLHVAITLYVSNKQNDIIKAIIDKKPNFSIRNYKGETCLDIALHINNFPNELISYLIKAYECNSQLSLMTINNPTQKNNLNINQNSYLSMSDKQKITSKQGISDIAFKFPLENSFNKIDIPYSNHNSIDQHNKETGNQFHSYIKIKEGPTLVLDIANDNGGDNQVNLQTKIETLKVNNQQQDALIKALENKITKTKSENDLILNEIKALKEKLCERDAKIMKLNLNIKENDEKHRKKVEDFNDSYEEKALHFTKLKEQYDHLEKDLNTPSMQRNDNNICNNTIEIIQDDFHKMNIDYKNSINFFKKKFESELYDNYYIQKSLQIDLLDFQEYVKEQIKEVKPKLEELIEVIQNIVNDSIGSNYEVKLYGSHATNLCLPWSDLDVVIVKREKDISSSSFPLDELYKSMHDNVNFKTVDYIKTTAIPLIKIETSENFNNMSVDISLQDQKHHGIECVDHVNKLIAKYEVLTPMVLASKNILKQAYLNNPYKGGLSSYGLILLIVFFLEEQVSKNKSVKMLDWNLGRLFHEFLYFYGMEFDPHKTIIVTDNTHDQTNYFEHFYSDLVIIDPLNHENNIGKNTRQFANIKYAFMFGFMTSKEDCECGCHYQFSNGHPAKNVEHCILMRIFNGVKRLNMNC